MLHSPLKAGRLELLHGRAFDAVVIGGGINGTAAADALSSAGYDVLLVEKNDFGSGSSSRSSRGMHCGLNYLAMAKDARSIKAKLSHLLLARKMMRERARLTRAYPDRMVLKTLHIPLRKGDAIRPWQFDLAFFLLRCLGGYTTPLNYKRVKLRDIALHPLQPVFGKRDLIGIVSFSEAVFNWPERMCIDYAISAAAKGATALNYATLDRVDRCHSTWELTIRDTLRPGDLATVKTRATINMAGVWSDEVNALNPSNAAPTITPNKGCHFAVKLPAELQNVGIVNRNTLGHMFICMPWNDFHIIGPSETTIDSVDTPVIATDRDIDALLDEARVVMPGARLDRCSVLFRWAGMRPATYETGNKLGTWVRKVYADKADDGLLWMSISWGRLADHAITAADVVERVSDLLGAPSVNSSRHPGGRGVDGRRVRSDIEHVVATEAPATVADVMFGRLGWGWQTDLGLSKTAEVVAALARTAENKSAEQFVEEYKHYLEGTFGFLSSNRNRAEAPN
jgi:glycerol-3-phosphate dehydrogenase